MMTATTTTTSNSKITVETNNPSPRGPGIEVAYDEKTNTNLVQSIARQSSLAIQELERVLFFTDLNDDKKREQAARDGLHAVEDLEELLVISGDLEELLVISDHNHELRPPRDGDVIEIEPPQDGDDPTGCGRIVVRNSDENSYKNITTNNPRTHSFGSSYGKEASGCTHHVACYGMDDDDYIMPSVSKNRNANTTDLALKKIGGPGFTMNRLVEILKAHFLAVLQSSHKAWQGMGEASYNTAKEAERKLFFTDLDKSKMAEEPAVWKDVEVVLQDMERQLGTVIETAQPALERSSTYLQEMKRQSQVVFKEAERTLLFTDLEDNNKKNKTDLYLSNDDGAIEAVPHDDIEAIADI